MNIVNRRRNMGNNKPTVIWNQHFRIEPSILGTFNGVTISFNDGTANIVGTYEGESARAVFLSRGIVFVSTQGFPGVPIGHKWYVSMFPSNFPVVRQNWWIYKTGTGDSLYSNGTKALIVTIPSNWSVHACYILFNTAVGNSYDVSFTPLIFDLTKMFGEGNEPTSVAQFEQWFVDNIGALDGDYPYNIGEEIKVKYLPKDM